MKAPLKGAIECLLTVRQLTSGLALHGSHRLLRVAAGCWLGLQPNILAWLCFALLGVSCMATYISPCALPDWTLLHIQVQVALDGGSGASRLVAGACADDVEQLRLVHAPPNTKGKK